MEYYFMHERGDYQPLPLGPIYHSWSGKIRSTVRYNESPFFVIYRNSSCRIYSFKNQHEKTSKYVFNKVNNDEKFVSQVKKNFDKKFDQGQKFVNYLKNLTWDKLSNEEIFKVYDKYFQLYSEIIPFGEPLPYFLRENLEKILEKYFDKLGLSDKDKKVILASTYLSFINRQDEELYALINVKNKEELNKKLEKHVEKYQWYFFDYSSLVCDKKYFTKRFREFKKKKPSFPNISKIIKDKEKIFSQYKIDKLYHYYIKVLEDLFYLMDCKKEIMTKLHFYIFPAYREIAKRLDLDFDLALWARWPELKVSLQNNIKIDKQKLRKRREFSVVKCEDGNYKFLSDRERDKLVKEIEADEVTILQQTIKGFPAYAGKVRGRVCVLSSAKQNNKIKPGEILVVSNTTPDFMPAIRRAKAMVTNEGGITCHATIISRELNIPCIVGTKIATKVLRDGDMVEVDADHGVVKILNTHILGKVVRINKK